MVTQTKLCDLVRFLWAGLSVALYAVRSTRLADEAIETCVDFCGDAGTLRQFVVKLRERRMDGVRLANDLRVI